MESSFITFCWLATETTILTWKNIIKRGVVGPNFCCLCTQNSETIDHVFVFCRFAQNVWNEVTNILHFPFYWSNLSVEVCFFLWEINSGIHTNMPLFVLWGIWGHMNIIIFEEVEVNIN